MRAHESSELFTLALFRAAAARSALYYLPLFVLIALQASRWRSPLRNRPRLSDELTQPLERNKHTMSAVCDKQQRPGRVESVEICRLICGFFGGSMHAIIAATVRLDIWADNGRHGRECNSAIGTKMAALGQEYTQRLRVAALSDTMV